LATPSRSSCGGCARPSAAASHATHPRAGQHDPPHGIYVNDDRVIQFGPGIAGKAHAKIEAVSLADFERHGPAEVVRHRRVTPLSGYLFEADEPWKIVARAEFLLNLQPHLPYNLIGHNCEHIANMCVAGGYTESHQVRTMFGAKAYLTVPFFFWYSYLVGHKMPIPKALSKQRAGGVRHRRPNRHRGLQPPHQAVLGRDQRTVVRARARAVAGFAAFRWRRS
jgi:hypothetical protein